MSQMPKSRIPARECKGCGRLVGFAKDENGKIQVLDVNAPIYVQIRDNERGEQQVMRVQGFVSHFLTCPRASELSRAKQRSLSEVAKGDEQ